MVVKDLQNIEVKVLILVMSLVMGFIMDINFQEEKPITEIIVLKDKLILKLSEMVS